MYQNWTYRHDRYNKKAADLIFYSRWTEKKEFAQCAKDLKDEMNDIGTTMEPCVV